MMNQLEILFNPAEEQKGKIPELYEEITYSFIEN